MLCCVVLCCVVLCCVVFCCVVLCYVVLCCVLLSCFVLCCVVLCCVVLCCVVLCCVVLCGVVLCCVVLCCVLPRSLLPEGNGWDVYQRIQVNGRGCVFRARAVCMCVGLGGERGSRKDLVDPPLATVLIRGPPAALPPALLAGVGAAPATPTQLCCPGPGRPSAAW